MPKSSPVYRMKWYAVFRGEKPGVYNTWTEGNKQVDGFPGNLYQSYRTKAEAEHEYQAYKTVSCSSSLVSKSFLATRSRNNKPLIKVKSSSSSLEMNTRLGVNQSMPPLVDVDQELSDAESRVGDTQMEEVQKEMEFQPPENKAVLPPVVPTEDPRKGWTRVLRFRDPDNNPFFHDLLKKTLSCYYPDLQAMLQYCCTEHRRPQMSSRWETELRIIVVDANTQARKVKSIHIPWVSRKTMERSMKDAACNALIYYWGIRFNATQNDGLMRYPHYLSEENIWTIAVMESSIVHQAKVELVQELVTTVGDLKDELLHERRVNEQLQDELDRLNAQLDQHKLHEKNHKPSSA